MEQKHQADCLTRTKYPAWLDDSIVTSYSTYCTCTKTSNLSLEPHYSYCPRYKSKATWWLSACTCDATGHQPECAHLIDPYMYCNCDYLADKEPMETPQTDRERIAVLETVVQKLQADLAEAYRRIDEISEGHLVAQEAINNIASNNMRLVAERLQGHDNDMQQLNERINGTTEPTVHTMWHPVNLEQPEPADTRQQETLEDRLRNLDQYYMGTIEDLYSKVEALEDTLTETPATPDTNEWLENWLQAMEKDFNYFIAEAYQRINQIAKSVERQTNTPYTGENTWSTPFHTNTGTPFNTDTWPPHQETK